jgi:hypothetical protein
MPPPLAALAPWLPLTSAKHDSAGSRAQRQSHPIRPYLDSHRFDPETIQAMGIASRWRAQRFELRTVTISPMSSSSPPGSSVLPRRASVTLTPCVEAH